MTRCWERENFEAETGKRCEYNHCGNAELINGVYYCPTDGKVEGYGTWCADRKPYQMSLLNMERRSENEV